MSVDYDHLPLQELISAAEIQRRVAELGDEISQSYRESNGYENPLTVITVLNGAIFFGADLIRRLALPLYLDTIAAGSYNGMASSGSLQIRSKLKLPVQNRLVLLIDDILDSGLSLARLSVFLRHAGAVDVKTCVLLDKEVPRHAEGLAHADFTAFQIPPRYVVGYGMDAEERYRNLDSIMMVTSGESSR